MQNFDCKSSLVVRVSWAETALPIWKHMFYCIIWNQNHNEFNGLSSWAKTNVTKAEAVSTVSEFTSGIKALKINCDTTNFCVWLASTIFDYVLQLAFELWLPVYWIHGFCIIDAVIVCVCTNGQIMQWHDRWANYSHRFFSDMVGFCWFSWELTTCKLMQTSQWLRVML